MRYLTTPSNPFLAFDSFDANDADAEIAAWVEQAEGDLSALTDDELVELRTNLQGVYSAARPEARTAEDVERLTRLAAAITACDTDGTRRETEAAEIQASLAALDTQVGVGDDEADDTGADENDQADPALSIDPATEDPAPEATPPAADPERTTASATQPSAVSLTGLGAFRTTPPAPTDSPNPLDRFTAASTLLDSDPQAARGYTSPDALGQAIKRLADSLKVSNPSQRKHYLGTLRTRAGEGERIVDLDSYGRDHAEASVSALKEATDRVMASRRAVAADRESGANRLTASGGMCAVAQPDYNVTLIGEEGTNFVQTLPTIAGSRPLEYYPWLEVDVTSSTRREAPFENDPDPWDATGHVTEAQDAAGYVSQGGPTPDKDCLHIDCIGTKTCTLAATYRCVTIGNFQFHAFPELVEAFDRYTRIGFDYQRDARAQATILADANAKLVQGDAVFGAAVDILGRIRYLAQTIRSTRRSPNLSIDVYLPAFAGDVLAQDIATAMFNQNGLTVSASQALGILGVVENIHVNTYTASWGATDDGSPTILPKQLAGAIGDWPTEVRIAMWPTGTVFHQQGWELSFGLRETLKGTNDFGTFYELAEATCTRGSDIYFLDQQICVNGARGAAVARDCFPPDPEVDPEEG